jgi:hypothetical protein
VFNKQTVFIIGAGASAEFDMPLGPALVSRVANAVNHGPGGEINDQALRDRMRECVGPDHAERLIKLGPRLAAVAPRFVSMDEALHFLSDEPKIVELGKIAISHEIMKAERGSRLYGALHDNEDNIAASKDSWANSFLGMALSGSRRQEITQLFANVTIIDFNYDRVLPQFLHWVIQRDLAISPENAAECVKNLRIFHPYGSLGPVEWLTNTGSVPFGAEQANLADISSRIRTYTEETGDPELEQIQSAIHNGRVLVVIGFGFHRQNIRIVSANHQRHGIRVFMTVYAIGDPNHPTVKREMQTAFRCDDAEPEIFDGIGRDFLQRQALSIRLASS